MKFCKRQTQRKEPPIVTPNCDSLVTNPLPPKHELSDISNVLEFSNRVCVRHTHMRFCGERYGLAPIAIPTAPYLDFFFHDGTRKTYQVVRRSGCYHPYESFGAGTRRAPSYSLQGDNYCLRANRVLLSAPGSMELKNELGLRGDGRVPSRIITTHLKKMLTLAFYVLSRVQLGIQEEPHGLGAY